MKDEREFKDRIVMMNKFVDHFAKHMKDFIKDIPIRDDATMVSMMYGEAMKILALNALQAAPNTQQVVELMEWAFSSAEMIYNSDQITTEKL